jgi:ribosomal protein S18 acetylase RimI-like enzyme
MNPFAAFACAYQSVFDILREEALNMGPEGIQMTDDQSIKEAVHNDARLIGNVIAHAFHDDPVNLWMLGSTRPMEPLFYRLAKFTYLAKGFGHIVGDGLGATLWLPPGEDKDVTFLQTLSMAVPLIGLGGPRAALRALAVEKAEIENQPKDPHYYLFAIGVRPERQGQGLGSALLRSALRRCDEEGQPAFLESSKERNLPIYRSHGFEVINKYSSAKGCPPLWGMWRDPQ